MRVLREIAEAIGRSLKIPVVAKSPEEAAGHFGWLAFFAGMDAPHPRTQDTDSLEQIPQLAHVVRPVVLRQARGTCSSLGKLSAFDLLFAEPVSGA
jgi:hypothetical protein